MTAGERTNEQRMARTMEGAERVAENALPNEIASSLNDDVVEIRVMGKGASDAVLQNANGPNVIDDDFCRGLDRSWATSVNLAAAIVS